MRRHSALLLTLLAISGPVLPAAAAVSTGGPLVFIGGGKDQDDVMKAFVGLAGGDAHRVLIMPLASDNPTRSGKDYVTYLGQLGFPGSGYLVPKGEPDAAALQRITGARGLFFSGGDQARILAGLSPAWRAAIATAWRQGAAIAGTSAGAMVWGSTAILDGDPLETAWYGDNPEHHGIRLGHGLALEPGLVVDTHFSQRGRIPRLVYAVARTPGAAGLGVDPETAAVVRANGQLSVLGRGTVTLIHVPPQPLKAPLALANVRLDVLSAGSEARMPEAAR